MQHIFSWNIGGGGWLVGVFLLGFFFLYTRWLRISHICTSVKVLNDTQIYKLWAFSMSNPNIENKTLKFLPEKAVVMLSEKYNTGIITKYATSIKDSSLLKLPQKRLLSNSQELFKIMELWCLIRSFLIHGQVGCCGLHTAKQNTPELCHLTYRLLWCFLLEEILENNWNLSVIRILGALI